MEKKPGRKGKGYYKSPLSGILGLTANVKPRKQSSDSVPKSHRFNSSFGLSPTKNKSVNKFDISV